MNRSFQHALVCAAAAAILAGCDNHAKRISDLPEPLSAGVIDAGPIQIPRIEIAPLSISSLSNEQEHK